ncbi:MAG: FCD domain-containing protein [Elsteraceae bacterium]
MFHTAMYDHSQRYRMLSLTVKPSPRAQSALEHKMLHDAALARDAEGAVAALRQHILKAGAAAGAETAALAGKLKKPSGRKAP